MGSNGLFTRNDRELAEATAHVRALEARLANRVAWIDSVATPALAELALLRRESAELAHILNRARRQARQSQAFADSVLANRPDSVPRDTVVELVIAQALADAETEARACNASLENCAAARDLAETTLQTVRDSVARFPAFLDSLAVSNDLRVRAARPDLLQRMGGEMLRFGLPVAIVVTILAVVF